MKDKTIAILMATYNGEQFLSEQINSILNQTCQDWHLYVHDDGSKDATTSILANYKDKNPDKITLLDYPSQGGACKNFLSMLEKVEASYYMFCDQDDVWLPEKVALSLQEMKRLETLSPHKAIVIHTDLYIVDEKLSVTYDSMWKFSGIYPQYIKTFNDAGGHTTIATGCTMFFNQTAKECCNLSATKAIMHDCWLCLCTLKQGGMVHGINKQLVLYRQHDNNCLGSGGTEAKAVNLCYRIRHIGKIYSSNHTYYTMLSSLGYGSVLKYIVYKIRYKERIRKGRY